MRMNVKKGSYTVEAAILIPFFLLIMTGTLRAGITLYTQIKTAQEQQFLGELWAVGDFYRYQTVGEWIKNE